MRYKAVMILGRLGNVARFAIPDLREALKDKDGRVRVKAAEALWKIEKPPARVVLPVLRTALKDRDPAVRALVPPVLALIGKPARPMFPILFEALKDKDINVRMEVVLALGELGPLATESIPALLALERDADFFILEPMISVSLGNMGAAAVPDLTKALSAKEPGIRRMAAYALGLIGPHARQAVSPLNDAAHRQGEPGPGPGGQGAGERRPRSEGRRSSTARSCSRTRTSAFAWRPAWLSGN